VTGDLLPLLRPKNYAAPSLFEPANLLREARRQRRLAVADVPRVALLDPDGDIVRYLSTASRGRRHPGWACYHTDMWTTDLDGAEISVVGMAVGAPFAVLVAEQLAASGAELVLSITSAGQIGQLPHTPCFVLIERALRDEGTSVHYLPPSRWSRLDPRLRERLDGASEGLPEPVLTGALMDHRCAPTARPPTRSRRPKSTARCASRWRPQPYTRTPPLAIARWSAWPT